MAGDFDQYITSDWPTVTGLVFAVRSEFISPSVCAKLQVCVQRLVNIQTHKDTQTNSILTILYDYLRKLS